LFIRSGSRTVELNVVNNKRLQSKQPRMHQAIQPVAVGVRRFRLPVSTITTTTTLLTYSRSNDRAPPPLVVPVVHHPPSPSPPVEGQELSTSSHRRVRSTVVRLACLIRLHHPRSDQELRNFRRRNRSIISTIISADSSARIIIIIILINNNNNNNTMKTAPCHQHHRLLAVAVSASGSTTIITCTSPAVAVTTSHSRPRAPEAVSILHPVWSAVDLFSEQLFPLQRLQRLGITDRVPTGAMVAARLLQPVEQSVAATHQRHHPDTVEVEMACTTDSRQDPTVSHQSTIISMARRLIRP